MILVSACLLGHKVRYDGRHALSEEIKALVGSEPVLALCPEVLGGLGVPRPPARFVGAAWGREGLDLIEGRARLLNDQGRDVSAAFVHGAREVARLAREHRVRLALLKDRSPSCGWDPAGINPAGGPGQGVLAAVLKAVGVEVREVRANGRG
ncbi:MAG: DUF523 domain-containing protein [Desulfarculaceae bacterium]|nr:DUF523 domain-containing protein [Desulfarculaceae bacterium]MCF8072350.1 DUF523 domain-containing protein [Desulfarculaceae bacterium]MCF8100271.1 DUF523 domain-containing protein [Desulfarculaceae bacterium]MCF8116156.1 DUF523 domain-containing protein [Desulfarculaceae bacterium]